MNKKWWLKLSGALLTAMLITGCADDEDAPPGEDQNVENRMDEGTDNDVMPEEGETPQTDEEGNVTDDENGMGEQDRTETGEQPGNDESNNQ
jgi:hypothetical protein